MARVSKTLWYISNKIICTRKGTTEQAKPPAVKRARKTKEGGSSGGVLIGEVVDERTKAML
jgi:hypothetical protein